VRRRRPAGPTRQDSGSADPYRDPTSPGSVPWTASRPYPSEPAQEVFDGIIEVFDVDTATLMATVRTDAVMMGFIGGGEFIALYREDTFGVPFIDVAQLRLLRADSLPLLSRSVPLACRRWRRPKIHAGGVWAMKGVARRRFGERHLRAVHQGAQVA